MTESWFALEEGGEWDARTAQASPLLTTQDHSLDQAAEMRVTRRALFDRSEKPGLDTAQTFGCECHMQCKTICKNPLDQATTHGVDTQRKAVLT